LSAYYFNQLDYCFADISSQNNLDSLLKSRLEFKHLQMFQYQHWSHI